MSDQYAALIAHLEREAIYMEQEARKRREIIDAIHSLTNGGASVGTGQLPIPATIQVKSPITMMQAAVAAVRKAGTPIPTKEIVRRMREDGYRYHGSNRQLAKSVGSGIRRLVTQNQTFKRVQDGVYGLMEWDKTDG